VHYIVITLILRDCFCPYLCDYIDQSHHGMTRILTFKYSVAEALRFFDRRPFTPALYDTGAKLTVIVEETSDTPECEQKEIQDTNRGINRRNVINKKRFWSAMVKILII